MARPRKPVAVEEALPPRIERPSNTITNCIPGTRLFLDDGRCLEFDESADVSAEEAAFLRERGQAQ